MSFEQKDFPVYDKIQQLGVPGADDLKAAFDKAQGGTDRQKWAFAAHMQLLSLDEAGAHIMPQLTEDDKKKTLAKTLEVFEDLAKKNNPEGLVSSGYCRAVGIGCEPDAVKAREWLGEAWRQAVAKKLPGYLKPTLTEGSEALHRLERAGNKPKF